MTYLQALSLRGYHVWLTPDGKLRINPQPEPGIRQKIISNRQHIIDELLLHTETLYQQVLGLEERITQHYLQSRASEHDTVRRLQYIYRLTAAAPTAEQPCQCGETLLWRYREEAQNPGELPMLCYTCHPIKDIWAAELYLATYTRH